MEFGNGQIDLKAALNSLNEIRGGREPMRRHPSPGAVSRSQNHSPGGHRSSFTDQRRNASSPYSTSYLSPPPMDFRRTISDSALHQTGLLSINGNSSPHFQSGSSSPRRSTVHNIDNTSVFITSSNGSSYASVMPMARDPGKENSLVSNSSNLLSASLPNDSRSKSCEVPYIAIHPSPDDNNAIHHLNQYSNTGGSLPNLAIFQSAAPVSPIDLDEQTMNVLSREVESNQVNQGLRSYDNVASPETSPVSYPCYVSSNSSDAINTITCNNTYSNAPNSDYVNRNNLSLTGYESPNTLFSNTGDNQMRVLQNGVDNRMNANNVIHSNNNPHHQLKQHIHLSSSQINQQRFSNNIIGTYFSSSATTQKSLNSFSNPNSCIDSNNQSLTRQDCSTTNHRENDIGNSGKDHPMNDETRHSDVFSEFFAHSDSQDVSSIESFVPQGSPSHQQISSKMDCHRRSTTPSDHSSSAPTSPVSGNMSPISAPGSVGTVNKVPSYNSCHNIHQTNVLQQQLEQIKMAPDLRQDSSDNYLLMPEGSTSINSPGSSASSSSGGLYMSANNTLAPSQENLVDAVEIKSNITSSVPNMVDSASKAQSSQIYINSSQSEVLNQFSSSSLYTTNDLSSSSSVHHSPYSPQLNLSSAATGIPNIEITGTVIN